jgi:hypothetical protein
MVEARRKSLARDFCGHSADIQLFNDSKLRNFNNLCLTIM